jgi:hypothetical protein
MFDPAKVEMDAEMVELKGSVRGCLFLSVFKAEERKG